MSEPMSDAIHSPSTRHKQAATDHEIAALQHRTAAQFHDQGKLHAARLSAEGARECCIKAHKQSMLACQQFPEATAPAPLLPDSPARAVEAFQSD